jgi:hypothetical protein
MTRADLMRLLAQAIRAAALTQLQADAVLAAFDAGTLDPSTLPPEVRDGLDGTGLLAASAGVSAALILLARTKAAASGSWAYDVAARRYITPTRVTVPAGATVPAPVPLGAGARLTPEQVRSVADTVIDALEPEMARVGEQLAASRITLAEWFARMEDMIAERHLLAAAAARGGLDQLTEADRVWVRDRIVEQFQFLDGFADDLASGRQALDGRYAQRVRQYAQAPRGTYEAMRGRVAADAGADEEFNVLAAADHCDLCVGETRRGWVPIGTLVPVGQRTCRANDRCTLRYRTAARREVAA